MRRLPYALFLVLLSIPFSISIAQTQGHPRVVLGRPFVALNGPWKFHPGDDIRWASTEFDDSSWTTMDLKPVASDIAKGGNGYVPGWTARGFPGLSGYAWYRLRVDVENDDDDRDGRPALALESLAARMVLTSCGSTAKLWVNWATSVPNSRRFTVPILAPSLYQMAFTTALSRSLFACGWIRPLP